MTDLTSRLGEAQKQIRIAGEKIDDETLVEQLEEAEAIIESVEGDLADRSGDV